jgi:hypothetical protein
LHLCAPPDGDLDVSLGGQIGTKTAATFHKLRGVYQKDDLSQESNRFLAAKSERFCLYKNDSV